MRRLASALATFVVASLGVTLPALTAPPASAAVPAAETSSILVTNQYGGSTCANQQLFVANALTGALTSNLGTPNSSFGVFNEAKPFDNNRKIVALWGGSSDHGQLGGVGVYDRVAGAWTSSFTLSTGIERGAESPHSITVLPDGYYAVAHVGSVDGTGSGYVMVFSPTGTKVQQVALNSAHGVEWDSSRGYLYAVGYSYAKKYSYSTTTHTISEVASYSLPTTGGHDLRRRRVDNDFFLTTNSQVYVFRPDATTKFTTLTKSDGTSIGGGVKNVDQRFDGLTEYAYMEQNYFYFTDRARVAGQFCASPYKAGRWLYAIGDPVYSDDGAPPPPPPATSADPFVWASELIRPNAASRPVEKFWVGGAAYADKEGVKKNLASAVTAGKTPYVFFYHFGDNGSPTMGNVQNATTSQMEEWKLFATRIAEGIGASSEAYVVVEPEWDTNISGACTSKYTTALRSVIDIFERIAPKARLINGPGLWNPNDSAFSCFKTAASWFDLQGFLHHVVSNHSDCTWRSNREAFTGGTSLSTALGIVDRVRSKADRVKRLFGGGNVILTDLGVTRCGWGDSGQAQIFAKLVDALPSLYNEIGLRGTMIRTGGPGNLDERYLGVNNEGMFDYDNKPGEVEVDRGKTVIQNHLNAISTTTTDPPTFTSAATAPSSVAPGSPALIQATVTNTKSSLTNGIVDLEVHDATGKVAQQYFTAQSFANGESRTYEWEWAGSLTPGSYRVFVGVFASGWNPQYHEHFTSTYITVGSAAPAFTSSASASPATVAPDGTTTITATVTNTGGTLTDGIVDLQVISPTGTKVDEKYFTGQTIAGAASATYTMAWTAPVTDGTYTIRVAVHGASWSPTYHSNGNAGTIDVGPGHFSSAVSASPTTVVPGGTSTLTTTVTGVGRSLTNGIVAVEVYNGDGVRVAQQDWSGQNIASGASATYTYAWTAPSAVGAYTVKVGVWGAGWTPTYHWNARAASVGVAAPDFESAADASPATIAPGTATTVGVNVTTTGGTISNAIVDLEIFEPAGTRVYQKSWSGQTLTHGTTSTYAQAWTAPATTGSYRVKVGVFGAGWTPTHHWNSDADSIVVANPAFTSSAVVSASSVAAGGTTTITGSYTNTGGSMANGIVGLEVYNPSGTKVTQKTWSGQAIANGDTATYAYTWTAPTTAGTYTVKLAVWDSDWSPTWHWNNGAATISVGSTSFQPSFRVGSGANTWWIELYTSDDVTAVDVIGDDGRFYLSLPKKSWGAWAATPPSELMSGDLVRFIARRSSDGASASSSNFGWLTQTPTTSAGWASTFTRSSSVSTSWVEVSVSSAATAVEVKVGTGAFTALTKQSGGTWAKAMTVPAGSKVVFRAARSDGARAYSTVYTWMQ